MASEQLVYPQAYIAQGSGDLLSVTDFKVSLKNGAKLVHTIRNRGGGITFASDECTVSFNAVISEDGPERPFWSDVQKKRIKQWRVKAPGDVVFTINGVADSVELDGPLDDATKVAVNIIGRLDPVED